MPCARCRSRRPDELRNKACGCASPGRRLHRPHSQRRQADGFTGGTANQVRVRHQHANSENDRPHGADNAARPRRRGDRMKRREFILALGGAAAPSLLWPLAPRAQQPAMPVSGVLGATSAQGYAAQLAAFRRGLAAVGFVEGRDVEIEYRWAEDRYDRLPELATELLRRQVAVITTI